MNWAIDLLEAMDRAVAWLGPNGDVRAITSLAQRRLAAYFPAFGAERSANGKLPEALGRWLRTLDHPDVAAAGVRGRGRRAQSDGTLAVPGRAGTLLLRAVPARSADGYLLLMDERLDAAPGQPTDPGLASAAAALPRRCRRLLGPLLAGRSEKQIAAELGLAAHTVHEYVKRIYATLGVGSRPELLARWMNGVHPPPPAKLPHRPTT